jgi:hypothetical protein
MRRLSVSAVALLVLPIAHIGFTHVQIPRSDTTAAAQLVVSASDLTRLGDWTPEAADTPEETKIGKYADRIYLACVHQLGGLYAQASPAIAGLGGGDVTANVQSNGFSLRGSKIDASVTSDAAFVSTNRQAAID